MSITVCIRKYFQNLNVQVVEQFEPDIMNEANKQTKNKNLWIMNV